MVLDGIVSSTLKQLSNLCPLVPIILMSFNDDTVLFISPIPSFDTRIQMVVPSLSALLTYATW